MPHTGAWPDPELANWKQIGYGDMRTHETQEESSKRDGWISPAVQIYDRKQRVRGGQAICLSVGSGSLKTKAAAAKTPGNTGFVQTCPCCGC